MEEGWLYFAAVPDLFPRRVIGSAMRQMMETKLVETALHMALAARQPEAGFLHHSDHSYQAIASAYLSCLKATKSGVSMSRVGNCYDNVVMESFFASLKSECETDVFARRAQARSAIFENEIANQSTRQRNRTPFLQGPVSLCYRRECSVFTRTDLSK